MSAVAARSALDADARPAARGGGAGEKLCGSVAAGSFSTTDNNFPFESGHPNNPQALAFFSLRL